MAANFDTTNKTYVIEISREDMRKVAKRYGVLLSDDQCDQLIDYVEEDAFDFERFEHYLNFDMIPGALHYCE